MLEKLLGFIMPGNDSAPEKGEKSRESGLTLKSATLAFVKSAFEGLKAKGGERLKVFWNSLITELSELNEAKGAEKGKVDEAAKEAVESTNVQDLQKAAGIETEKIDDTNERETVERVYATLTAAIKKLPGVYDDGKAGLEKIKAGGEFSLKEALGVSSIGLQTMLDLKNHEAYSGKQEAFQTMLELVFNHSKSGAYDLEKIFGLAGLKKLFKIDFGALGGNILAGMSLLEKLGIPLDEASGIREKLGNLGKAGMTDKEKKQVAEVFEKHLLKKSGADNVEKFIDLLNKMISGSSDAISPEQITDLVYLLDDDDLENLIEITSSV